MAQDSGGTGKRRGSGRPFAKGLVRYSSVALAELAGSRTSDLPDGAPHEVIHRDDLVVLP